MVIILYLLTTIGLIFIITKLIKNNSVQSDEPSCNVLPQILPYEKKFLLTKAEYAFYQILKKECDKNNLLICPKVRLEDFITVTDKEHYSKYRGYIKSRHIDFLICNSKLHIIAGLELDDNTHNQTKNQKVDEFKNSLFQAIKLPLFRIKMSNGVYQQQIDKILTELLPKQTSSVTSTEIPQLNQVVNDPHN